MANKRPPTAFFSTFSTTPLLFGELRFQGQRSKVASSEGQLSPTLFADNADICCPQSFWGSLNIKLDNLTFLQRAVTPSLNGSVVDEDIFTVLLLNETIALLVTEPFDTTYWHGLRPPILFRLTGTRRRLAPLEDASPSKHQPFSHRPSLLQSN
jgi:hypothetical protein